MRLSLTRFDQHGFELQLNRRIHKHFMGPGYLMEIKLLSVLTMGNILSDALFQHKLLGIRILNRRRNSNCYLNVTDYITLLFYKGNQNLDYQITKF